MKKESFVMMASNKMIDLEKFSCCCTKCYCQNDVYESGKICAECAFGLHEGPKN